MRFVLAEGIARDYTPSGVEPGGYHAIEVKTTRDGAEVRARRGYFGS